ncbi:unnamed protein product [Tuber melanosporum]|uniref:(Perigord truffle) hypothetical protein n=1 Tax=Tuber melanosporum (strain Mel28) TaxID=656061 RepID=D5GDZ0_TUBMM|nr:unnamed protein product [Tuber melanosporum]
MYTKITTKVKKTIPCEV